MSRVKYLWGEIRYNGKIIIRRKDILLYVLTVMS